MAYEVLDDIIEELANDLGIYGQHVEEHPDCECRMCWTSGIASRIREAISIESAVFAAKDMSAAALESGAIGEVRTAKADRPKGGGF